MEKSRQAERGVGVDVWKRAKNQAHETAVQEIRASCRVQLNTVSSGHGG
jgi:hypothetical protein